MPRISHAAKARIDALLSHAGKDLPALWFMAADADGVFYRECAGDVVYGQPEKGQVGFGNTLQLFSMTKLATSLACIQLVERGKLSYDDPAVIRAHLPELCDQPLLLSIEDGVEVLAPRTAPLTLRHLLTHTSGLAYDFAHPLQLQWSAAHRFRGPLARHAAVADLCSPLMFEPGTDFTYSIASDWAGLLVQRVSGLGLEEYFQTHLFSPCGISAEDLTFYPTDSIRRRLVHMSGRTDGGTGTPTPSRGFRHVAAMQPSDIGIPAGGAGLLGTLDAYMLLLREVLACHSRDGIITRASCRDYVFASALPDVPRGNLGNIMAILGDSTEVFTSGEGLGFSMALAVTQVDSPHGRRKGTGFWSGAAGTYYWIDPESGIVGICATQILDMAPHIMCDVYNQYERALYDALEPRAAL